MASEEETREKHTLNDEYACKCGCKFTVKKVDGLEGGVKTYTYYDRDGEVIGFEEYDEDGNLISEI